MAGVSPGKPISLLARFGNGVALPMAVFVLWQWALVGWTGSKGGFGGMVLFFASLAIVPALAVLELWVLAVRWRGHFRAFFGGLALPAVVGAAEVVVVNAGSRPQSFVHDVAQSAYLPLFLIALATPLIVAVTMAIARWRRERRAALPA